MTQNRIELWEKDRRQAWEWDYKGSHSKPSLPLTLTARCRLPALAETPLLRESIPALRGRFQNYKKGLATEMTPIHIPSSKIAVKNLLEAGGMAQQVLAVKPVNLSLIPGNHMVRGKPAPENCAQTSTQELRLFSNI